MKTILLIDDEEEVCKCIRDLLDREHKVLTAFSGKDSLTILQKEKVSLVILDYMLPDIDGLELLKNIKENHKIPVIMITAFGDKEIILKCLRYRADWYFDKPFKLRELREKVHELLKSPSDAFPFNALSINPSELSHDVLRALKLIGENLSNPKGFSKKNTLKEISAITSFTPKHLSYLFKKECGQSIKQIIKTLKIEKAKEILKNEEKDIKKIALELGFKHSNNFSSSFKKLIGKSPSEFRN